MSLYSDLMRWRDEQARREGTDSFKVLSKAAIDGVLASLPKDKAGLMAVKGIKEAKYRKYGQAIIALVERYYPTTESQHEEKFQQLEASEFLAGDASATEEVLSVSQFLDGLNLELSGMAARIKGEVTSVDVRERVVYFTIKDARDESMLSCLIFRSAYQISGVELAIGDEIIIEGAPEIYKPNGRMSFKVGVIELFGEGTLKKAYDLLYQKLEQQGFFSPERKRVLKEYPERIALITSRDGAAIDDFKMNLGNYGFQVDFFPTPVEGKKAVFEILEAIRYFNQHPERYDVLVIVRGGGSLESLQAFNNEALVEAVASSHIPTLLGVGHEKDVTLAALASDSMVSTPTATAKTLALSWSEARQEIGHMERQLPLLFQEQIFETEREVNTYSEALAGYVELFRQRVSDAKQTVTEELAVLLEYTRQKQEELFLTQGKLRENFQFMLARFQKGIDLSEERLLQYDPRRVLHLGYSLIRQGNAVLKSATKTKVGDILDIQLAKGSLSAEVKKIIQ